MVGGRAQSSPRPGRAVPCSVVPGPGVTSPKSRPSGMSSRPRWLQSRSCLSSRARYLPARCASMRSWRYTALLTCRFRARGAPSSSCPPRPCGRSRRDPPGAAGGSARSRRGGWRGEPAVASPKAGGSSIESRQLPTAGTSRATPPGTSRRYGSTAASGLILKQALRGRSRRPLRRRRETRDRAYDIRLRQRWWRGRATWPSTLQ